MNAIKLHQAANKYFGYTDLLTAQDRLLYLAIVDITDEFYGMGARVGKPWGIPLKTLIEHCAISKNTIYRSRDNLRDCGLLNYVSSGADGIATSYTLTTPSAWRWKAREGKNRIRTINYMTDAEFADFVRRHNGDPNIDIRENSGVQTELDPFFANDDGERHSAPNAVADDFPVERFPMPKHEKKPTTKLIDEFSEVEYINVGGDKVVHSLKTDKYYTIDSNGFFIPCVIHSDN